MSRGGCSRQESSW
eukprot:gene25911-biopygen17872